MLYRSRSIALAALLAFSLAADKGPAGASNSQGSIPRLLQLEQARSLGDGTLAQMLDTGSERLAVRAALAIGRTKQPAAAAILLRHVADPRPAVRAMVLYALGLLADGHGIEAMLRGMHDRNSAVRVGALDALDREVMGKHLGTRDLARAAADEIHAALHDRNPILRRLAAIDLVGLRSGSHAIAARRALLAVFARDRDLSVRRAAMWAIFRGYAAKVPRQTLLRALASPDSVVRIEAVRAIGRSRDAGLIAALEPLLHDSSWRVQEQASESIRQLRKQPPTLDWKTIPPWVHPEPVTHSPLDALRALPRIPQPALAGPPNPLRIQGAPWLDPTTAAGMTGPAPGAHPRVRIVTTKGDIYLMLFPEWAPLTVANFLNVAARGYYDNQPWFRIVPDFVVQTGDPSATAPGLHYTIGAEENPMLQGTGVLSMGLDYPHGKPARDSASTEYYITLSPQYHLDRDFTVFGKVIAGSAVLSHLVESDRVLRVERIPGGDVTGSPR